MQREEPRMRLGLNVGSEPSCQRAQTQQNTRHPRHSRHECQYGVKCKLGIAANLPTIQVACANEALQRGHVPQQACANMQTSKSACATAGMCHSRHVPKCKRQFIG